MRAIVTLALVLLVLPAVPVAAQNMGFLGNSPAAYFTADDVKLFQDTGRAALETLNPGKVAKWENPTTGARGKIKVLAAFASQDGRTCKRVGIYNKARGVEGESKMTLCRTVDGHWQVDPDATPAGK